MLVLFLFSLFKSTTSEILIGLITSDLTDLTYLSLLSSSLPGLQFKIRNSLDLSEPPEFLWVKIELANNKAPWSIPNEFFERQVQVILDAGNLEVYSEYLSIQAIINDLLHVIIDRPINTLVGEIPSANTLFTVLNYITEAMALHDLIQNYGWQNLALIYDESTNNIEIAKSLKSMLTLPIEIKDELILNEFDTMSYQTLYRRLESTTRDSDARVIVVMASPILASMLLRAADESVMGGSGYAWIFSSSTMSYIGQIAKDSHADIAPETFGILKTGAIGIMAVDQMGLVENRLEDIESILYAIVNAVHILGDVTGTELCQYILMNPHIHSLNKSVRFDSTGVKITDLYMYNMHNFAVNLVGLWDYSLRSYSFEGYQEIVWPGLSTIPPNDKIPIIKLGLLYPLTDIEGKIDPNGQEIKNGFDLAISEINSIAGFLGDYMIQTVAKDTLLSTSLAAVNLKQLASYNILGFVGPYGSDLAIAYAQASGSSTKQIPIVSYEATDSSLSDSTIYPSFLRTVQPDGLQAVAVAMVLNIYNWKSIGVIYTTDSMGVGIYESFQSNVKTLDIIMENDEDKKTVRVSVSSSGSLDQVTLDDIENALDEIVRKQIKIIVFLGNPVISLQLAKVGHAKELFGSEYSWIGTMWLDDGILSDLDTTYADDKSNILKVLNGAVGLAYRGALDVDGATFAASYKAAYNAEYTSFAMLAYDTAYLFGYTLQGMISRGEDFNSGKDLVDSLRAADFNGASGKIKFSEGTNDRSAYGYTIINVQDGKLIKVKEYDPINPNMFNDYDNVTLIWGGGELSPPSDSWSQYYDCPFAEHMSKVDSTGVAIIIVIGVVLFLLTLGLSIFSYKKWRQIEIILITEPVVRSWKDTLVQIQIFIEYFQFIAIAPTFQSLKIVVEAASNIFMLDIMKVAQSSKGDYWIMLGAVCALCYSWFVLVILIMANAEIWLKRVPLCQRMLSLMNALFLPFFGNTMFLPSLALLLDVFVCDHQAQGHAYVWRDCYMECWGDKHKPYIVMSVIAIALYEPVAVFSRPLWQQAKTGLNIKIKPFFLLFKTCMQILLIAVGKSLQGITPMGHGVVFSVLMLGFTITTYKIQPFNYHRCNLWEFSSLLAVSYMSILATLSYAGDSTNIGWFIGLIIGWLIIIGGTILYQRKYMPNLLVPAGDNKSRKKLYDVLSSNKVVNYEDDNSKGELNAEIPYNHGGGNVPESSFIPNNNNGGQSYSEDEVIPIN